MLTNQDILDFFRAYGVNSCRPFAQQHAGKWFKVTAADPKGNRVRQLVGWTTYSSPRLLFMPGTPMTGGDTYYKDYDVITLDGYDVNNRLFRCSHDYVEYESATPNGIKEVKKEEVAEEVRHITISFDGKAAITIPKLTNTLTWHEYLGFREQSQLIDLLEEKNY